MSHASQAPEFRIVLCVLVYKHSCDRPDHGSVGGCIVPLKVYHIVYEDIAINNILVEFNLIKT